MYLHVRTLNISKIYRIAGNCWCTFSYELAIRTARDSYVDRIAVRSVDFRMMLYITKYTKMSENNPLYGSADTIL